MPKPWFKIVTGSGDGGSPLADEPTVETFDKALAAAHEYRRRQRHGGTGVLLSIVIEETRPDGAVVKHSVV